MAAASSNEFQLIVSKTAQNAEVKLGSDVTVPCYLSPEISAVDMEIRWFKGTDCVCLYKIRQMTEGRNYEDRVNLLTHELERGNVSLSLRDFRESDVGDYVCQVTSGYRTEEMTIQVKEARVDPDIQPVCQSPIFQGGCVQLTLHEVKTTWSKRQRMKMEESALMTELVINNNKELHQKLYKILKDQIKMLEQTELKLKETIMDLRKKLEGKSDAKQLRENSDPLENKESQIQQLEKQPVEKDNEDEQNQLENLIRPMGEKERLLENTVKELETSKHQQQNTRQLRGSGQVKLCSILGGNTKNSHRSFIDTLINRIQNLREVSTVDESDIVLVFCSIVSRAGTDIEAALKRFTDSTASKMNVLVVLHHTFDPEKTVSDSSRCVNRSDILTVDCLFYEDTGLLECQKNQDAIDKVVNLLQHQGKTTGVNVCPTQSGLKDLTRKYSSDPVTNQEQKRKRAHKSMEQDEGESEAVKTKRMKTMNESQMCSTKEVKVCITLCGKTNGTHKEFFNTLSSRIKFLKEVSTVDESDIVLVFCPIVSRAGTDIEAALKRFRDSTASRLNVLVVLHHTFDPEKTVSDSSRCVNRSDILTVDCLFYEDTGLLKCQKNQDAMKKVVNWLIQQGKTMEVNLCQNGSSVRRLFSWLDFPQWIKTGSLRHNH